jgi:RNA polymerase sigma-70 factor (ECF subfamily)
MASNRDERRFQEIFRQHHRTVYAYCRRRTDAPSAQDAAAETFLVVWRRIEDVPDDDRALPWLYGVARRVLANQLRSQRRHQRRINRTGSLRADPLPDPETIVIRRSEDQEVLDALDRLRPQDGELLRLAVWEELPHAVIGEILGCSAHAVDQRIRRAADRLASELNHRMPHYGRTATPNPTQRGEPT